MHVGAAVPRRTADKLFLKCDATNRRAENAIARSRHLLQFAVRARKQSLLIRMASRRSSRYASVEGILSNLGSNLGEPLGEVGMAPAEGHDPLLETVTAARSCDRVGSIGIYRAGARPHLPAIQLAASSRGRLTPIDDELPAPLAIEEAGDESERVVRLRGELDIADADRARDVLIGTAGSRTVVDLSALTFIDARGISAIVTAHSAITGAGHSCSVRGAQGIVRRVFELIELETLLDD